MAIVNSKLPALGFDLDGTLLDHRTSATDAIIALAKRCGWSFDEFQLGQRWAELENHFFPKFLAGEMTMTQQRHERIKEILMFLEHSPGEFELAQLFEEYVNLYSSNWKAFADVPPTLKKMKALGYQMAILTNGYKVQQEAKLNLLGIRHYFEFVLTIEDVTGLKPDSRAFLCLTERMKCKTSEVIYIGDDFAIDYLGAKNAGLSAIWINRNKETNSDISVIQSSNFENLLGML